MYFNLYLILFSNMFEVSNHICFVIIVHNNNLRCFFFCDNKMFIHTFFEISSTLGHSLGSRWFYHLLVLADEFWKVVCDSHIQPVDRAAPEVGASGCELLELVQRVQPEEVSVGLRIWEVIAGNVGEGAEALVDVVVLRMLDDGLRNYLLVSENRLVVVVSRQVAVDHLGVIPYSYLERFFLSVFNFLI